MPSPFKLSGSEGLSADEDLIRSLAQDIKGGKYDEANLEQTFDEFTPDGEKVAFIKELMGLEFENREDSERMERIVSYAHEAVLNRLDSVYNQAETDGAELFRITKENYENSEGRRGTADLFYKALESSIELYDAIHTAEKKFNSEGTYTFDTDFTKFVNNVAGGLDLNHLRNTVFQVERFANTPLNHEDGTQKTQEELDFEDRLHILRVALSGDTSDDSGLLRGEVHRLLEGNDPLYTMEKALNAPYDSSHERLRVSKRLAVGPLMGSSKYLQLGGELQVLASEAREFYRNLVDQHPEWLHSEDVPNGKEMHDAALKVSVVSHAYTDLSEYANRRLELVKKTMQMEEVHGDEAGIVRIGLEKPVDIKAWLEERSRPDLLRPEGPMTDAERAELAEITQRRAEKTLATNKPPEFQPRFYDKFQDKRYHKLWSKGKLD